MVDDTKKQFFQTHQDSCIYELTETVAVHTQCAQVQARCDPQTEMLTCSQSLIPDQDSIDNCLERENQFHPMESYEVYQPHSRADLMPRRSWPTQNDLHVCLGILGVFWGLGLCVCFFVCLFVRVLLVSSRLAFLILSLWFLCFDFHSCFVLRGKTLSWGEGS